MYFVTLNEDKTIICVYDKEVYVDENVELIPITDEQFEKIWKSGRNGDWILQDGVLIHNPTEQIPPKSDPTRPINNMPVEIL